MSQLVRHYNCQYVQIPSSQLSYTMATTSARAGPDSVTRTRGGPGTGTLCTTPQQIGMFDFSTLPSLVFVKLLRFLSPEFRDVRNLSYVSCDMRERVMAYLDILYTRHLHLDNSAKTEGIDLTKPILSLKLTCSAELLSCPDIDSHALFIKQIGSMDLSNLKSLEIRNLSRQNRRAFKSLMQILPLNPFLYCKNSLECLCMDVCLINLSEIRDSIINVVYQHDDFATGGPITNVDYIVNSAVSQVLYSFLQFIDDLYSGANADRYDPYGRSQLRKLEINFLSEDQCDWSDLDPANFSHLEVTQLRDCLSFMINEFKERIVLNYEISEEISAKGIPNLFHSDALSLVFKGLSESTKFWPVKEADEKPFTVSDEKFEDNFNLNVIFHPVKL